MCLCSLLIPEELALTPGLTADDAGTAVSVDWVSWCANCKAGETSVRGVGDGFACLAGEGDTSQQEQLDAVAGFRLFRGIWKLIEIALIN